MLLPPPHGAGAGAGFGPVFPTVFRAVTVLLELVFSSLLLLGVEVTAVEVSLLSCTSPSCCRDKEGVEVRVQLRRDTTLLSFSSLTACASDGPLSKAGLDFTVDICVGADNFNLVPVSLLSFHSVL